MSSMESLYQRGLILSDTVEFEERRDLRRELRSVLVHGRIHCPHRAVLRVHKLLDVRRGRRNRYEVLGCDYSYHAFIGDEESYLFRYDNAHGDTSTLHLHIYDEDGREVSKEDILLLELPRLDLIVEMTVDAASKRRV
jgi:hypothetical protein